MLFCEYNKWNESLKLIFFCKLNNILKMVR